MAQPTVVLAADGRVLASFEQGLQERVKLSQISPNVINALISTEDRRFYEHHGVDFTRVGGALLASLHGDTQGGSTITQQLARNMFPEEIGRSRSLTRKAKAPMCSSTRSCRPSGAITTGCARRATPTATPCCIWPMA